MKQLRVIQTFVSRFLILIVNFGLVIFSTNMWGSEGKGVISIVVANVAMVSFFSSVFSGSSTSYFARKFRIEQVLSYSYIWSFLAGIIIPLILHIFHEGYLFYLMAIAVLSSVLSTNISLFIGTQDIKRYNLYTVLQQLLHVIFLVILILVADVRDVSLYFLAQVICLLILATVSTLQILRKCSIRNFILSKKVFSDMLEYGWKTQLSAFVQFLNYRLSFYFLEHFQGLAAVGIFSIGITFSEAIWTITRSIAVVLYSDVVNSRSHAESIQKTKASLKVAFSLMAVFFIGIILIPSEVYVLIFGKDFGETRFIMLLLTPGIFAIAVSDMIGYYFSAVKELRILNIKSFVGLIITIVFSLIAIPRWGITGACVVTVTSYVVSAAILFRRFYQTTGFSVKDYLITPAEVKVLLKTFSGKKE